MLEWRELFSALALLLVFEGMMPFINPARWRATMANITNKPDKMLRSIGFISMILGVSLLYTVR